MSSLALCLMIMIHNFEDRIHCSRRMLDPQMNVCISAKRHLDELLRASRTLLDSERRRSIGVKASKRWRTCVNSYGQTSSIGFKEADSVAFPRDLNLRVLDLIRAAITPR